MFSLKYLRENLEFIEDCLKRRGSDFDFEKLKRLLDEYRELLLKVENDRAKRNENADKIGALKSSRQEVSDALLDEMRALSQKLKRNETDLEVMDGLLLEMLASIPNILDERVKLGKSDEENEEIKRVGNPRSFDFKPLDHVEIAERHAIIDFERATKIVGSRFSHYRGYGAKLHRALIQFFLDENTQRGFEEHFPPFIANETSLFTSGQFPKFEDQVFPLTVESPYFLIPTAEVPLMSFFRDEILKEEDLPLRMVAYSSCFRSEAGAAGKYSRGSFRNHQFEKVEIVSLSRQEDSDKEHHFMLQTAENLLQKLKLPYRVVRLCSGDIGFAAKMCYDIEVWIPSLGKYMEISSLSNCGDFQAQRGKIRYKTKEGKNELVHSLNGSSLAVGRCLIAILENYQEKDGSVVIPEVLRPYTGFDVIK